MEHPPILSPHLPALFLDPAPLHRIDGGGKYTYAEVPLFDWISEVFGWERNNYDKIGHFMQGFVPALIAREILIRKEIVNFKGWRNFLIVSVCLAFSAFYELIEWWAAELIGEDADAFLGTQGYVGIPSPTWPSRCWEQSAAY